jgi:hypothetical protein
VKFNAKLDRMPGCEAMPRIQFLSCSVYMLTKNKLGRVGVLVEKMLNPVEYKKWNNNNGFVDSQPSTSILHALDQHDGNASLLESLRRTERRRSKRRRTKRRRTGMTRQGTSSGLLVIFRRRSRTSPTNNPVEGC